MASLLERLTGDLKDAMRAADTLRRDEIRGLIAQLKAEQQAEIDRLRSSVVLSDDEEQAVLAMRVKQHRQSLDGFLRGKRDDLIKVEEAQLKVDLAYQPEQLDQDEVERAIQAAISQSGAQGPRDQGKVMGLLSARLRGKADMKAVAARVQEQLSAPS